MTDNPSQSKMKQEKSNVSSFISNLAVKKITECAPSDTIVPLSRPVRWTIYILLVFLSIISSIDGGVIPAATERMREDLHLNDANLGVFGSSDYVGRLFGSLIFIAIINKFHRKALLISTVLLKAFALCVFYLSSELWVCLLSRGIGGLCQVFLTIYLPVWCDQFGVGRAKTMMITIVQVGNPVGLVVGFGLTTIIKYNWMLAFAIEGMIMCCLAIAIFPFPSKYFSATITLSRNTITETPPDDISVYKDLRDNRLTATAKVSTLSNIGTILCEMTFLFSALCNSAIFLVMTAVQYWGADYMLFSLKVDNDYQRLVAYSLVSITGPTCGVILGGIVGSLIGGYEAKHSILICIIFTFISCCFAFPLTMVNGLIWFSLLLWGYFFFSGALIPIITGIIISSVPLKLRGAAFSVTNFLLNLLGNLPAPFIYGLINNTFKETNDRMAMMLVMYYNFLALFFVIVGSIFRYRKFAVEKVEVLEPLEEERIRRRRTSQLSGSIAQIFGSYGHPEETIAIAAIPEVEEECPVTTSNAVTSQGSSE